MKPFIRNANEQDLEYLLEGLHKNAILQNQNRKAVQEVTPEQTQYLKEAIQKKWVRILELEKEPAGFLIFRADVELSYRDQQVFWVDLIFIEEKLRGHGLGRILYKDAGELANGFGYSKIIVDVFDANQKKSDFHHEMGFRKIYGVFDLPK